MPCCSGESPARWCWRKGGRSRQPPGKGGRPADSRGVRVPGGLLEHPCGASLLLSQPPLGVSPLPRRMRWSGKEAALSNSHWRQPEAPQSPLLPPPPPDPGLLSPCISGIVSPVPRPGGSRGVAAQSCTLQFDHTVRLVSGGLLGCRPVSLMGSEEAVGVPPAPVGWDVAQAVSHWGFPSPHRGSAAVLLGGQCCGHTAVAQTELQIPFVPLPASAWLRCLAGASPHFSRFVWLFVAHCSVSPKYLCQHPVGTTSVPGQDTGSQCGDSCETETTSGGSLPCDQTRCQV